MKKYIIYIGILIVGTLLGYVFFGNVKEATTTQNHEAHTEASDELWTCSMHPQIQKHEPGDCPICGMELIPVDASNSGLTKDQFRMTPDAIALANIQTTVIGENAAGENAIQLSGKIQPNENQVFAQSAHFNGRVEKLYVKTLGETVQKGQALAQIYSPELINAQQELLTTYSNKERQPKLYDAVRNKFKNWMIPQKELDKVIQKQEVLQRLTIYSHVSGVVTKLPIQEGGHIIKGMAIIEVTKLNSVWAVFDVYENQIAAVKEGQKIEISVQALPNKTFSSKISFVEPLLDTQTRTIKARAVLQNEANSLKPGMFTEGKIQVKNTANQKTISIPKSAVLWTGKRSVVYVKPESNESVFEMREVSLGQENGSQYIITKGLKPGEEIVVNGTFTVDAAAQLQGKKSMMNQGEATAEISKDEQASFQKLLQTYFNLKNAFVNDDLAAVETTSEAFSSELKNTKLFKESTSQQKFLNIIQKSSIALQNEETLKNKRMHFIAISENMVEVVSKFNGFQDEIFIQKCPMANNNEGARWLSDSNTIENPYFGASMLACGSVVDVVQ